MAVDEDAEGDQGKDFVIQRQQEQGVFRQFLLFRRFQRALLGKDGFGQRVQRASQQNSSRPAAGQRFVLASFEVSCEAVSNGVGFELPLSLDVVDIVQDARNCNR